MFTYIFNKYSTINFKIFAINEFFEIKTKGSYNPLVKDDKLTVKFFRKITDYHSPMFEQKASMIHLKKGERKLKIEFDYTKIIKEIKKL